MDLQALQVSARKDTGKKAARKVRGEGHVPLVLYGGDKEPVGLSVNERLLDLLLHGKAGEHAIVQLDVKDNPELNTPALIKEVQHHKVQGNVLHADFMRIRLDEKIITLVAVKILGQAVGIVEGGVLDHVLREIEVECLALEVPDSFEADVTNLAIGDSLKVSDLTSPDNVAILTDPTRTLIAIHAPRVIEEEAPAELEEGEIPEGEEGETPEGEGEGEGKGEGGEEKSKEEGKKK